MLRACLIVIAAALLTGCTHTRTFDAYSLETRATVNKRAERATSTVVLISGEQVTARSLHVAPDVTTWVDPKNGEVRSAPTAEVASVRFTSRGRGVLEGLGIGFAVGIGLGALVGADIGTNNDGTASNAAAGALVGAVLLGVPFGVPSAGIGGLVGLAVGSKTKYVVRQPTRDR